VKGLAIPLVVLCSLGGAAVGAGGPQNLALGKKYTLVPAPNYRLCTDPQDKVQLTDGTYTKGYFWTQKTTVGWQNANPVRITIDLATVQPIAGLSFNAAAGTAGVGWPISILVLVSADGRTYYLAGDLVELSAAEHGQPKAQGYSVHRFATSRLRTRGRYVQLVVFGGGPFVFVDEIEIHRGPREFLSLKPPGRPIEKIDDFYRKIAVVRGVCRRLRLDLADVRNLAERCNQAATWAGRFREIERQISTLDFEPGPDFRTVFPIVPLHGRIFEIQAALWRASGLSGLLVWQKNRWDMLSPTELPRPGPVALDVQMMRNEYRGAAFNLSNAAETTAGISLAIEGLPGGTNPAYVTVHEVPFTDTRSGVAIAAAMPEARKADRAYRIEIEPGLTRQIWLSFHPRDLTAGLYEGAVAISPGPVKIPIKLRVYPFRFPDQPSLHLGGWDYTDRDSRYEVTPQNRAALIRDLRELFVDSPWATSAVLPPGKYDRQGNLIEQPQTRYFEQWLRRWPNARRYCVFASVGNTFAGFQIGTPAFENAVANWIGFWARQLPKWGIRPEQLCILLVDEPHSHEQDDTIIAYAALMHKAAPQVLVWEDPTWRQPWKARPRLFELCDVLCPNLPMLIAEGDRFADFYVGQRQAGKELWFYSCSGPGKLLDPYSYHRLQHWFCWKYGAKGSAFWAFGDSNGASSWNEYLALRGAYTPLFLDRRSVTAGKHAEAIREGVEDYEYLVMLEKMITELKARGKKAGPLSKAEHLLAGAADRVIEGQTPQRLYWHQPKNRSVADEVRLEILEIMTQLESL